MKLTKLLLVIFALSGLQACATVDAAKTGKGTGLVKTYSANYSNAWDASVQAVEDTNGKIVEQDKNAGSIVASYGVTAFSWGERVAVFLKSLGKSKTEVEVVSQRAVSVNVTAANWEPKIHDKISSNLDEK